jgi:hypothetical protein
MNLSEDDKMCMNVLEEDDGPIERYAAQLGISEICWLSSLQRTGEVEEALSCWE